jgi:hypothetical protein
VFTVIFQNQIHGILLDFSAQRKEQVQLFVIFEYVKVKRSSILHEFIREFILFLYRIPYVVMIQASFCKILGLNVSLAPDTPLGLFSLVPSEEWQCTHKVHDT